MVSEASNAAALVTGPVDGARPPWGAPEIDLSTRG
jgi:hypothetical protein